jgi:hypothetical protein
MSLKGSAFNAALYMRHVGNTYIFFRAHGRLPDYAEPRSFNDKVQWRKLFDRNRLFPCFVDKLAVRTYVGQRAPSVKFSQILWTGSDPGAVPYADLPERFVIKPSHRSGDSLFVRSRRELDRERIASTCRRWLYQPYGRSRREWANQRVEPRLMVEELLTTGSDPAYSRDYRCYVFDGLLAAVLVNPGQITDMAHRFVGTALVFDRVWNRLPYHRIFDDSPVVSDVAPPEGLDRLVDAAESLGRGIDCVRVDCFLIDGDVYFTELTIYPGSGMNTVDVDPTIASPTTEPFDEFLGKRWTLPPIPLRDRLSRGLLGRLPKGYGDL